jgi:hypothetical protein
MNDHDDESRLYELHSDAEIDELLRRVRADVHTDENVIARGRARVLAAAAELERAEPQSATNADSGPETSVRTVVSKPESRKPQRKRRSFLAVGAAAAVILGVVCAQLLPSQNAEIDPASAAVLDRAAQATGTDAPLRPGQYRYIETHAWTLTTLVEKDTTFRTETVTREWVPADERQEWLLRKEYSGKHEFLMGDERSAAGQIAAEEASNDEQMQAPCGDYSARSGPQVRQPCQGMDVGWGHPTAEWMASLPRDPVKLGERVRADVPDNDRGAAEVFDYATDLLRTGRVPADLRSALYKMLAAVPGIEKVDTMANLDGRVGVALGIEDDNSRHDIVIDPDTGQFIGERDVLTEDGDTGLKKGTVLTSSSVSVATADGLGVVPAK